MMNPDLPVVGAPAHVGAPPAAAPPAVAAPAAPGAVIAYANHFDTKHVVDAIDGTTAATVGAQRPAFVKYSTVFRRGYLEAAILGEASKKGVGDHNFSVAAHQLPAGDFQIAGPGKRARFSTMKSPMFFPKIVYSITVAVDGTKTVTVKHLETDF